MGKLNPYLMKLSLWWKKLGREKAALRVLLAIALVFLGGLFVGGLILTTTVLSGLPNVKKLSQYDPSQTTRIYSSDGTLIATLFDQNRTPVTIDEVSPLMQEAIISIEDRRFMEHGGVDFKGIARAALGNVVSGEVEQGASTLSMQLARRLFLSNERTYTRKLREAALAWKIDHQLSKEKILELYLNEVYFGSGAYGIDAASSLYFGKNPDELKLWQSALLAGLVQAPSAYSPLSDRQAALARTEEVLEAMESRGVITPEKKQQAVQEAAEYKFRNHGVAGGSGMLKYPYFTTYVIQQLSEHFPENYIRRGGLQVYTTLDRELQEQTELTVRSQVMGPGLSLGADSGAAVVLDNKTGDIKAMVGGTGWSDSDQFNRAWQAKRQPGSSFKMFVYAAALEHGFSPENEFADTESVFNYDTPNAWKPANSDGKFMGPIPMRTGLQFSRNVVAAKVMAHVGPDAVAGLAHRMGIENDLPRVISLALGAGEVSPLEMARAYSVLPNGGIKRPNLTITKVTDPDGEVLLDLAKDRNKTERVLGASTAATMSEMLRRVVTGGTGTAANVAGSWVAGKTGTTDKFIDAWFVGFTPHHTISVWVGRDDNQPMGRVYGGTLPAQIFRRVATQALKGHSPNAPLPGVNFAKDTVVELCWDSTYPALPGCPKTYSEHFYSGHIPTRKCPLHRKKTVKVETTLIKTEDGTITNLTPDVQASPTPEDVDVTEIEVEDPREDAEVVTPKTALIPYQEKEPEGKVEVEIDQLELEREYPEAGEVEGQGESKGGFKFYPTAEGENQPVHTADPEQPLGSKRDYPVADTADVQLEESDVYQVETSEEPVPEATPADPITE